MRVLIAGGAGFLGSHLAEHLLHRGDDVVVIDDLSSGRLSNIEPFLDNDRFTFIERDIRDDIEVHGTFDAVCNLASPASPPDYLQRPLYTLTTGSTGTQNLLEFAKKQGARFILASTSEVYGDPVVHPQTETYWGNVNPVGPRSAYDEAKRYAEALTTVFSTHHGVNTGIVRIFNTYGPRMRADDGRVVSSFIDQALQGLPLTVFGDGTQTRSLCYVDDLIGALIAMIDVDETGPINIGNPHELTILEIARAVTELTDSSFEIDYRPLPTDDPTRRRPDITRARALLNWEPRVSVTEGLERTIAWRLSQPAAGEAPVDDQMHVVR